MNAFTTIVEKHLTIQGVCRADLARMSDYSPSYMTNMLNGHRIPPADAVARIAAALGMSDDDTAALHTAAATMHGYEMGKK